MGWGSMFGILGLQADQQQAALSRATDKQENALRYATDIGNAQYNQTRADNMPALESRNWALTELQNRLSGSKPIDMSQEPGYQFGLDQGLKSMNNQLRARGMSDGGAALKAATRYGTDYASTKYDAAFARHTQPLMQLAGLGNAGSSTIAQAGQVNALQAANNAVEIGNVGATKSIGSVNIWNNALNKGMSMMSGGM